MMALMLPNPFLTNDQQIRDEPAWAQLELWDRLRATYLRLEPDPLDRSGKGFRHSLPFSGGISACGLMLASIGELVRQDISANAHIASPRTRIYDP